MKSSHPHFLLKQIQFYAVGILGFGLVQTFILHRLDIGWQTAIIDAAVSVLIFAFFCFNLSIIFSYYKPGKANLFYPALFAIAFSKLTTLLIGLALSWCFSGDANYLAFLEKSMPIRLVIFMMNFLFLTAMYWLWNRLNEQIENEKRQVDTEQLAKEAELAGLRQKLQPHFLFNSLNSISALALNKPNEARKMIQQLSDFLRGTLKKDEQQVITLKDELAHLNLYLEIEKVRFGHRLNIETTAEAQCLQHTLPPLLIQPLVENAIKFGLYGTLDETLITMRVHCENNYLVIQIVNPFDPQTQNANAGTGFGLSSVQRRLFLLYARTDLLHTEKKENTFITTLKIPQPTNA